MLEWFSCPDKEVTTVKDCLAKCRMDERCLTTPYLRRISQEREWNGVASTTQLINGTMYEFLKLTQPYVADPDKRAFMVQGSLHHESMEEMAKELGLPSEVALSLDRDIFDLLEPDEAGGWTLSDYKLWGSYRVAKALGIVVTGKVPDPTGAVYKSSSKWGKAGTPKMILTFKQSPKDADNWETDLQLNRYRVMLEERGIKVNRMQVQVTVRDGGLAIAVGRGLDRNTYKITIPELDNELVLSYFQDKADALEKALADGKWDRPCNEKECWDGVRCRDYCELARNCIKGLLYQKES
ncbi:hypothetical protein LCGC14_0393220 [marine sediment metagenome]|uniref:PD-(D/E)XK endonuclease-like domain-containing protein n=1 Tax=marine sediment metagenome TaxID=412755 RepID=A0A0F9VL50_9ZZZZ